ncbi:hypothetical protein M408DRAFT_324434 [Serendipita vermifera MAFF 305830]|uniref:Uncharacterized protein n=1 Tax=Serendipita vermifera MAFF 305830 TaxID=933852 RepID=A0A0C2WVV1_SERVB|nr:hypothetical protein M408DRAFT_324434 [Serendipita vermifera MAFF 305830]
MLFPNDSIFSPNQAYSLSLTKERVDAFSLIAPPMSDSSPPRGRSRKPTRKNSPQYMIAREAAAQRSPSDGADSKNKIHKRILQFYAGNTPEAKNRTLGKLDSHFLLHGETPIAPTGHEGPRGGNSQVKWNCRLCREDFPTFQKAAVHLTSGEWGMPNWRCLEKTWYYDSDRRTPSDPGHAQPASTGLEHDRFLGHLPASFDQGSAPLTTGEPHFNAYAGRGSPLNGPSYRPTPRSYGSEAATSPAMMGPMLPAQTPIYHHNEAYPFHSAHRYPSPIPDNGNVFLIDPRFVDQSSRPANYPINTHAHMHSQFNNYVQATYGNPGTVYASNATNNFSQRGTGPQNQDSPYADNYFPNQDPVWYGDSYLEPGEAYQGYSTSAISTTVSTRRLDNGSPLDSSIGLPMVRLWPITCYRSPAPGWGGEGGNMSARGAPATNLLSGSGIPAVVATIDSLVELGEVERELRLKGINESERWLLGGAGALTSVGVGCEISQFSGPSLLF